MSDDAVHDSVADDRPTAPVVNPVGVVGAEVSGHAIVVTVVVADPDTLPAPSTAATPKAYDVPQASPENVNVVPDAVPTCERPR